MSPLIRVNHKRFGSTLLLAVLVLLAAIGFSGCQMTSADGGPPAAAPPSATFSFCDKEASGCSGETSFSVAATLDLEVKVSWQNVPAGNHVQTLEILIPGGNLYQQTQMAFRVPQDSTEPLVAIQTLPVAGTWIQQRHIMGEWTARVSLDGQVVATQTVQLTP
ncbi:MAG: hypothetical protein WCD43_08855 [Candidatus Acidiferrales bacterium]